MFKNRLIRYSVFGPYSLFGPTLVKAEDLVIGDIIDIKFGDRIPADIRVVESKGFKGKLQQIL